MNARSLSVPQRPLLVRAALGLLIGACVLYVAHATLGLGSAGSSFYEHWVVDAVIGGSALICLHRALIVPSDRGAWAALGLAMTSYFAGDVYWNVELAALDVPPYPSLADAGWLIFYLPAYAGIALLLRSRARRVRLSEWLDGLIGALAVAAVATATVLDSLLHSSGASTAETATNLAYPIFDVVMLVFTVTAIGFIGRRPGGGWISLAIGLALFGVADTLYLLQTAGNTYVEGGLTDAGWPVAACLIAVAAWQPMASADARARHSLTEQGLIGGFATLALGVLVVDLIHPINGTARALAVTAMIAIVIRLVIAAHESRQIELARHAQSRTDDLTGLANRRGFYGHFDEQLEDLVSSGASAALLLMDLDHFKEFNDSLGHSAGDRLLQEVAIRLPRVLPAESFVARIGGDEFVVLLPADTGQHAAIEVAKAIGQVLAVPMQLSGISCHAAASIGVALIPEHGTDRAQLLQRADVAMYRAKDRGTGVELFNAELELVSREHITLAGELRRGIDHGELVLHYQPKARLGDGTVQAVEALVRWNHPTRGLLMPDEFLPFAERYGLMRLLTTAVLDAALAQEALWRRQGIALTLAVNLCGADLLDGEFPAQVAAALERHQTVRGALQFEITENIVMAEPERVLETLARLRPLGITFALDDYGTGHSSLAYLKRLPISELKIDRSFVWEMTSVDADSVIVRSTIELAHNLGVRVVAEGVETLEHWNLLAGFGCDTAQGFYLSRPVPAAELQTWLSAGSEHLGHAA